MYPQISKKGLCIRNVAGSDLDMPGNMTRGAPKGTPDRKASARSKIPLTEVVPKVLAPQSNEAASRADMSPATVALLRTMMHDEIKSALEEMEPTFGSKLEESLQGLRKELAAEGDARHQLEQRIKSVKGRNIEAQQRYGRPMEFDEVDKSVAVIGGFVAKAMEEVQCSMDELMNAVTGYQHAGYC